VANIFSYFVDDSGYPPDQNRLPVILGDPNSHADDCWQVLGHDSQIYPNKLVSSRSLLLSILEVLFRSKLGTFAKSAAGLAAKRACMSALWTTLSLGSTHHLLDPKAL
jgi:hypothetical protein